MALFLATFVCFYIMHAWGITIGYHRLLSHRSFSCPKAVEHFWVFWGYLAFEGSPIWWATMHRAHHRHVDTELDPHSPRFGFFNSFLGWTMHPTYLSHIDPNTQSRDLTNDPVYRFLEQDGNWNRAHAMNFALGFGFRAILWALFGWQIALASLLAGYAVLQIPLMLNVFCHMPKLGYKNYNSTDDSVNVPFVGILALGEGWHNNHHAAPGSAKSGMKWWEFDASWLMISLMNKLNLVSRVHVIENRELRINGARIPKRRGTKKLEPAMASVDDSLESSSWISVMPETRQPAVAGASVKRS